MLKNILKSVIYTFLTFLFIVFGIYRVVNLAFSNMSVEQSSTWIIICMCIGIIFTIFVCTFMIIDEVRHKKSL